MSSATSTADTARAGAAKSGAQPTRLSPEWLKAQLRGNTAVPLLVAGAAAVALIAALLMWVGGPEYRVLFSNLADGDGGRIIAELDKRNVPYRLSEGGQMIMVPGESVHVLRLQLAEQGLPQGGNVGLELMDNQAFGISQFSEQVHFQRGLEGELARSIKSLGPVSEARVHLALAKPTVFVREREPAKASVVLSLHPGRTLGEGQVAAITHLVASSVPDLAADNVTVVNQSGTLLSSIGGTPNDLDSAQLSYTQEMERIYQQRIENILLPLFGAHNIRIQVAAQIDFARREETAERYGPNQAPNEAAVRSLQQSSSYSGADEVARGIPGALSNTPPDQKPTPADTDTSSTADASQADQRQSSARNDNVINYEVDRNVTHIQHQRGQVDRLSVAVVVNYRDTQDDEGEPLRAPLSDTEMEQVTRLVRQAMGFSDSRGDDLEVVNSPFSIDYSPVEIQQPDWWSSPDTLALAAAFGRYLLVALLALALYLLIIRPLMRRHLAQPIGPRPRIEPPFAAGAAAAAAAPEFANAAEWDDEPVDDGQRESAIQRKRRRITSNYEQTIKEVRDAAREDPRLMSIVIRNWMNNND